MSYDWYHRHGLTRRVPQPVIPPQFAVDQTGRVVQTNPPPPQGPPSQQYPQQGPPQQQYQDPDPERAFMNAVTTWGGTTAAQQNAGLCPHCGSSNYFASLHGRLGHCFNCNYRPPRYGTTELGMLEGPQLQSTSRIPYGSLPQSDAVSYEAPEVTPWGRVGGLARA